MEHTVSYKTYLSKETTQGLKRILDKTKAITEIQVNGKVYMERKDYRTLQNIDEVAKDNNFRQIKPVYGAAQLLNLFEEKTERVRVSSKSSGTVSDFYAQVKKTMPTVPDMIIAHKNEIEIIPRGIYEAKAK